MNSNHLDIIKTKIYDKCRLKINDFKAETESKEYAACRYKLNGWNIVCRSAKITPKKVGQFVTFWKRNENGTIEPLNEKDQIDFYTINVQAENRFGQFVFPKAVLIKKGILSTKNKEGKRGFRVYPPWDKTKSKQAGKTQNWQLNFFYEIGEKTDFAKVKELYH